MIKRNRLDLYSVVECAAVVASCDTFPIIVCLLPCNKISIFLLLLGIQEHN